jgi:hypothetical protein
MSYLRGPLTRDQIKTLMAPRKAAPASAAPATAGATAPAVAGRAGRAPEAGDRPVLPPGVAQFFLPCTGEAPAGTPLVYEARALGLASVVFNNAKLGLSHAAGRARLAGVDVALGAADWEAGEDLAVTSRDLRSEPEGPAAYGTIPPAAARARTYDGWEKSFKAWVSQAAQIDLLQSARTGVVSAPGESERDFRIRLQTTIREQRDAALARLRQKHAPKLAALDEKIRRAAQAVDREAEQASQQKLQAGLSIGATVLGALFGRKAVSASTIGRATTAARGVGRSMKEQQDIARAKETLAAAQQQKAELEALVEAEVKAVADTLDPMTETLVPLPVKAKRTDVTVQAVGLAWVPYWDTPAGLKRA